MAPIKDLGREALLDAFAAATKGNTPDRPNLRAETASRIAGFPWRQGQLSNAELIGHFEFAALKGRPIDNYRKLLLERLRLMEEAPRTATVPTNS